MELLREDVRDHVASVEVPVPVEAASSRAMVERERERREALERYRVEDLDRDPALQDLARLAAEICGTPMAAVNFLDANRQVTGAAVGLALLETPREHSFCAWAMEDPRTMVVEDARLDPRLADNPLVTGAPGIVFYAGARLVSPAGHALGALCVLDRRPGAIDARQADALQVLARQVVAHLELRRLLGEQAQALEHGRRVEEDLRGVRDQLERRVQERTSELQRVNEELRAEVARRREAEARLLGERGMLHALLDNVEAGIVACDAEGRLTLFNRSAAEFHGLPPEPLPAESWAQRYDLFLADGQTRMKVEQIPLFRALGGEVVRGVEMVIRPRDLPARTLLASGQRMTDAEGRTLGAVVAMHDITEVKRQREARHQAEKLAAMGQLLAGVAHELNNPLAVALGQANMLRRRLRDEGDTARLQKIEAAVERCARIVRNFLALARQQPPERRPVLLAEAVEQAIELIAYPLRSDGIELRVQLAGDVPPVLGDAHQLQQVLINLLTNAHHALRSQEGPRRIVVRARTKDGGGTAVLEVEDNGPGIPEGVKARVFDPFFTTKAEGQGTGLGLSLCRGIVEGHGGKIVVLGAPGGGTLFRVELPAGGAEGPASAAPASGGAEAAPVRHARVLVVDDEPEVREVLADLLRADGHEVETAGDGREALALVQVHRFDLVISDLRMPVLDGPGLYRRLAATSPGLAGRFVIMTGDALTPTSREFLASAAVPFLAKPFDVAEVRRVAAAAAVAPSSEAEERK